MHLKLRLGRWQFNPGLWPTLAAALLILLTYSLGNWQMQRAAYKRTLQARIEAGEHDPALTVNNEHKTKEQVLYRQVIVEGVFDPAHEILLDNRIHNSVAGYYVLTPLKIKGSNLWILVNRGWVAVGQSRSLLPKITPLTTQVKITGLAVDPDTRYFELGSAQPQGRVWQNLNFKRYAEYSGLSLQPFVLQQRNDTGDGLIRIWTRPDTGVDTHMSYAMQWYGLAGTLAVLWLVINVKKSESGNDTTH